MEDGRQAPTPSLETGFNCGNRRSDGKRVGSNKAKGGSFDHHLIHCHEGKQAIG